MTSGNITEASCLFSRRAFVQSLCGGLGGIGLAAMLRGHLAAAASTSTHFIPKAKHVVFLFMTGGPSQMDMFDHKPALLKFAGQRLDSEPWIDYAQALLGTSELQYFH